MVRLRIFSFISIINICIIINNNISIEPNCVWWRRFSDPKLPGSVTAECRLVFARPYRIRLRSTGAAIMVFNWSQCPVNSYTLLSQTLASRPLNTPGRCSNANKFGPTTTTTPNINSNYSCGGATKNAWGRSPHICICVSKRERVRIDRAHNVHTPKFINFVHFGISAIDQRNKISLICTHILESKRVANTLLKHYN